MHQPIASTVEFLGRAKGLDFIDALSFCNMAVDYEVMAVVDGTKGIHAMVPKAILSGAKADPAYWYRSRGCARRAGPAPAREFSGDDTCSGGRGTVPAQS